MNKLKEAREARAITQKQLSIMSGVNLRSIQKYESGERDIHKAEVRTIIQLANALEVTIEDLVDGAEEQERRLNTLYEWASALGGKSGRNRAIIHGLYFALRAFKFDKDKLQEMLEMIER